MGAMEITLIIVGVIFLLGSFFVQDKLSSKDVEEIARVSEQEIHMIMEKQLSMANNEIENKVENVVEYSSDNSKRELERLTNEKIMAINEYSDTVLENINQSHNEIMFLYSMLNDKHTELTQLAGELSQLSANASKVEAQKAVPVMEEQQPKQVENNEVKSVSGTRPTSGQTRAKLFQKDTSLEPAGSKSFAEDREVEVLQQEIKAATQRKTTRKATTKNQVNNSQNELEQKKQTKATKVTAEAAAADVKTSKKKSVSSQTRGAVMPADSEDNHNLQILQLHQQGKADVEIARELGVGLGEVRLVIGLYRGES